jgi:CRP/FNR family transcriptional regulator, cyclic AMP receptor protein
MGSQPVINLFRHADDVASYPAGTLVFAAEQPGDAMFVVQEGEVDIVIRDQVVETVLAGGVLGELALIDHGPRSASARARTDCKLVRIDAQRFKFLVQQSPFFAIEVMRVMADRLRRMDARV